MDRLCETAGQSLRRSDDDTDITKPFGKHVGALSARTLNPWRGCEGTGRPTHRQGCVRFAAILGLMLFLPFMACADEFDRLRPADRSSPQTSLYGFVTTLDGTYGRLADALESYAISGRLYLSREERRMRIDALRRASGISSYLDLSRISPVLRDLVALERLVQLKEVLDRIPLPAADTVPNASTAAATGLKRWRIPNTEIDFVLTENGPQRGEYLVSADTIDRLPEYYDKVRDLPYRPGPAMRLNNVYRTLSGEQTDTIYERLLSSPIGLAIVVPVRWMLSLPEWARFKVAGTASWQWLGLAIGAALTWLILYSARLAAGWLAKDEAAESSLKWHALPIPLAILLISGLFVPLLCTLLRIGGTPRVLLTYAETGMFYLAIAWLAVVGWIILGEIIIASEQLKSGSLDSQLVMLATRSAGVLIAAGCITQGADDLGFPAYSVIAGLGIGGLAVALAARDTVANFIGSMLIILEKPFRVGHLIRVSGTEGTVENVGFRSTRIRTPDNSVVSIPSSVVVNTTVENLTLRPLRRQRFLVQVSYDTPRNRLQQFIDGIRALLGDHPQVNDDNSQVRLNAFGDSSLDILVMFHLSVETYAAELEAREEILLRIMDQATDLAIAFAFPTRTIHLTGPTSELGLPG